MTEFLEFAKSIAVNAGKLLLKHSQAGSQCLRRKDFGDFVTHADCLSEKQIVSAVKKRFPTHSILSEECGFVEEECRAACCWIIDPLDGTMNYAARNPFYAVSIALVKDDELECGVVYAPELKELYWAEKNKGAFLNSQRLRVSHRNNLENAVFMRGRYINFKKSGLVKEFEALSERAPNTRNYGCTSLHLAHVAAGKLDAAVIVRNNAWDYAAGVLLVKEAGGVITDFEGRPWNLETKHLIAANKVLHAKFLKAIKP